MLHNQFQVLFSLMEYCFDHNLFDEIHKLVNEKSISLLVLHTLLAVLHVALDTTILTRPELYE